MIIIFIYNKKGDLMSHVLLHTLLDTLKTIPILFVVYLFIEWLEHRVDFVKFMNGKGSRFGPLMGALVGCIPQCLSLIHISPPNSDLSPPLLLF